MKLASQILLGTFIAGSIAACGGSGTPRSPQQETTTTTTPTPPTPPAPGPSGPDSLTVVVLAVDSLMPEDINASMPNVSELIANGTIYRESRSVFSAETIPNHVAMMTGVYPDRNGIPTNNFWDREAQLASSDPTTYTEDQDLDNPNELQAKTLFTWIDEKCRQGATPLNANLKTAAVMSKTYLYEIFRGDANDPQTNDSRAPSTPVNNVEPDKHWEPASHPAYIGPGSEHTPDNGTAPQAVTDLPDADFIFINLGDVDRSSHAAGSGTRAAVKANTDVQVGTIIQHLKDTDRWKNTVFILSSDHGMDFSDPTNNPPNPATQFNSSFFNSILNSVSTQPMLDALHNDCGFAEMAAVQNGGTNSLAVIDTAATALQTEEALLAARACIMNSGSTPNGSPGAPNTCTATTAALIIDPIALVACQTAIAAVPKVGFDQIEHGWYANPALYNSNSLRGALSGDTGGIMPPSIKSRHENLGDLVLSMAAGSKFSEPDVTGNPILGNHGHMPTIHNTIIVSGGASFLKTGQDITTGSTNHLVRDDSQAENIDVAATVAWVLGLNIQDTDFPDFNRVDFPDYGETPVTRKGFDGRVLIEAFTIPESTPPSTCGKF